MAEAPAGNETLITEDATTIFEVLLPAQNQSYVLGLKLGLPLHEVESIYTLYQQPRDRLLQIIIAFLQQTNRPTWRMIVEALRNPVVNLSALASRVEEAHFPDPTATRPPPNASESVVTTSKENSQGDQVPPSSDVPSSAVVLAETSEEVKKMIRDLEQQFNSLKSRIREHLDSHKVLVAKVVDVLTSLSPEDDDRHKLFLESRIKALASAANHSELFGTMNHHWNYHDPSLLERLVKDLALDDFKDEMESYNGNLQRFRKRTPLTLYRRAQKRKRVRLTPDFWRVVAEFELSTTMTMDDAEQFRKEYASHYGLHEFAMMLDQVREGSTITTWSIPESVDNADEIAQEIIDEAMKSGSLQQRNVVGVITGLMGSGKTTLLHRIFGLPPPGLYTSTGAVEQSFRGFLHHIINLSVGAWQRLTHREIRELLAPLIKAGMREADVNLLATHLIREVDDASTQENDILTPLLLKENLVAAGSVLTRAKPTVSLSAAPAMEQKVSPACQDMVPLVAAAEDSAITASLPKDLVLDFVHMIDTGGQPELMEVMPSLIHNASLAIVLVDLRYGLDEHLRVSYHEHGVTYLREATSHYTSRDILLKLAATLHAKKSLHESFRLLIVATHRDCVQDEVESVRILNRELRRLLPLALKNNLIYSKAPDDIAFVLNLKNPSDQDLRSLDVIRSEVSKLELGKIFETPTAFFVLEQDLVQYAKDRVHRQILSLEECEQVGARLKMTHEMVVAALVLFHRQNTFLYFIHVLPNHVFIDPQVPLDIVNSIVKFRYKVNSGKFMGFPARFIDQLNDSMVSEELLGSHDISPHFEAGIYEIQDAIALFRHTFTVAPIHTTKKTACGAEYKKKLYLMMCLKPAIPEAEVNQHIPQSPDTVPLVVKFSSDCVPLGCFSSTVSCLISKYGWEVTRKEDGTPKCLNHNIVSLDTDLLVNVVLVDYTNYIEVHIDSDLSICDLPTDTCQRLYTTVFGGIEKVFAIMKISTDQINISPAVVCPCPKESQKHFATFAKRGEQYFLRCSQTTSKPSSEHLLWMGKPDTFNSKPNLPLLMRMNIPEQIGAKYQTFGTLILNDRDGCIIGGMEKTCRYNADEMSISILRYWLQKEPTPITWNNLIQVLKKSQLNATAQLVEQKLN